MNEILIRAFSPEDLTQGDSLLQTLSALSEVGELTPKEKSKIAYAFSNPPYYVFVATSGGRIVGTTTLFIEQKIIHAGGLCGHIEDVAVRADMQGHGIGGKLIQAALEKARVEGCYKVILDCSEDNVSFYEKQGFRKHENCMRIDLK